MPNIVLIVNLSKVDPDNFHNAIATKAKCFNFDHIYEYRKLTTATLREALFEGVFLDDLAARHFYKNTIGSHFRGNYRNKLLDWFLQTMTRNYDELLNYLSDEDLQRFKNVSLLNYPYTAYVVLEKETIR